MMKKALANAIHIFSVLLVMTSVSLLILGPPSGMAFQYLSQANFINSTEFETLVSENITDIFDYTDLKDTFENQGKLALNKVMAQANSGGNLVSYSLDYLLRYARSKGYYLNEKNEIIFSGSEAERQEAALPSSERVSVIYRAYMPNFKPSSPSDGIMSLSELSLETLNYLSKYYELRSRYFDNPTNLQFCIYYYSNGRSTTYTNAPDESPEDMLTRGKYLYTSSETVEVKTNLSAVPSNVIPLLQAKNPYSGGSFYLVFGIDTAFPQRDYLRRTEQQYSLRRRVSLICLCLLALGALGALLSFIAMLRFSGHTEQTAVRLLPFDRVPAELSLLLLVPLHQLSALFSPELMRSAALVLGQLPHQPYWEQLLQLSLFYAAALLILFSLVRQYKAGVFWQRSLCSRLSRFFARLLTDAQQSMPKLYAFLVFILPNLGGLGLIAVLIFRFLARHSLMSFLTALALCIILPMIDYYAYRVARGLHDAVDEQVKSERLKADLITNVSHDIKTPLTSIINYVDLLKREQLDNPRARGYLEILEQKSARLKTLTEDLVEASKASSGNVSMEFSRIDLNAIALQAAGEFEEKLQLRHLELITDLPEHPSYIYADGRRIWRVLENLLNNTCKYALEGSRVYMDVSTDAQQACFTIKNISEAPLNISPDELTERFVRGDVSRSTEGSGLGLSIAKSLTQLMGGRLVIAIDGDLYKASLYFPIYQEEKAT